MGNQLSQVEVKALIPHTWPLFFARYGRFTPIQQQAIPGIREGHDTLVIAATASGKTEAVLAPLLERFWEPLKQPSLQLLYICPTRALVRDLYERLRPILQDTAVTLNYKTGDVTLRQLPALLITTPESTDSLLARKPRAFTELRAIVLDEIHLFDNTPRGDHLRCLLPRIERIRQYAHPHTLPTQRVLLSATVPDPAGVAHRYLHNGLIIQALDGRPIDADIHPLYSLDELIAALTARSAYKTLIFCNSREEVETTAVTLRQRLPHQADIFVHYSNLDAVVRQEVEERFAASATAVCVCTSTLELGVDIGTVDDVVLLGAPPDLNAFLQRIGRGSRRSNQTRALCMPKSPGEWARFEAMLTLAQQDNSIPQTPTTNHQQLTTNHQQLYTFRPSVLIQQTFSLMRQSPTGAVRLADLRRLAPSEITSEEIRKIITNLSYEGYVQSGRPGEWKPDKKLQELLDAYEIHSNIGADVLAYTAVDSHSGRTLAYTDRAYPVGKVVLLGGQSMAVVWAKGRQFGLTAVTDSPDEQLPFQTSYAAIPFGLTQAIARSLHIAPGQMVTLAQERGGYLFHFWGTIWGALLAGLLEQQGVSATHLNEYCLFIHQLPTQLPPAGETVLRQAARKNIVWLTNRLAMGRFHSLLPADVAMTATLHQLDLPRFLAQYQTAVLNPYPDLYPQLTALAGAG